MLIQSGKFHKLLRYHNFNSLCVFTTHVVTNCSFSWLCVLKEYVCVYKHTLLHICNWFYLCGKDIPYFVARSKSQSLILPFCPTRKFSMECFNDLKSLPICLLVIFMVLESQIRMAFLKWLTTVRERQHTSPTGVGDKFLGKIRAKQCDEFLDFCQTRKERLTHFHAPQILCNVKSHLNKLGI